MVSDKSLKQRNQKRSEATRAIEARSLRGAKEKTEALPRCFSERKLKMVPPDRLELSHLSVLDFESSASTNSTMEAIKWSKPHEGKLVSQVAFNLQSVLASIRGLRAFGA